METRVEIKKRIQKSINQADDKLLRMIDTLIEIYQSDDKDEESALSESKRRLLDKRLKFHEENPSNGKSWDELKGVLQQQYGL